MKKVQGLTDKQSEAYWWLTETSLSLKEIAHKMNIADVTLGIHITKCYMKSDVHNRYELMLKHWQDKLTQNRT